MKPIRVIGVGNTLAGDDAVGTLLTKRLDFNHSERVEIFEAGISGLNLLDFLEGAEAVILIDAIQSTQPPGTIHRLDIPRDLKSMDAHAWSSKSHSTHSFGLAEALILGTTLGTLPPQVIVYGIELQHTTLGGNPSREVNQALGDLTIHIQKEVDALTCMNSSS